MNTARTFSMRRQLSALAVLAAVGAVAAGCGGGGNKTATNLPPAGSPQHGGGAGLVITTGTGPLGTYLTDGKGVSLYMFASDTATKVTCAAQCLTYWPPLLHKGSIAVSGDANKTMLGTVSSQDGAAQVTYNGHPLYYFALDSGPGQTGGQGLSDFGAKWWLLGATGKPLTGATSGGSTSGSTSGGYGY